MQKPNYNYHYNYGTSPQKIQNQKYSPNIYYQQQYQNTNNININNPQIHPHSNVQYYPIQQYQRRPSSSHNSSKFITSQSSSFVVTSSNAKNKIQKKTSFLQKNQTQTQDDFYEIKSSKQIKHGYSNTATDNFYRGTDDGRKQREINENTSNNKVNRSTRNDSINSRFVQNNGINKDNTRLQVKGSQKILSQELSANTLAIQRYIKWLYDSFNEFQLTGNIKALKHINQSNERQTLRLFQQLYSQKQNLNFMTEKRQNKNMDSYHGLNKKSNVSGESKQNEQENKRKKTDIQSELKKLEEKRISIAKIINSQNQTSFKLDSQIQQEISFNQESSIDLNQSRIREQNHLKQMQESIIQLDEQVKLLQRKNGQLISKGSLMGLQFFKEWNMMFEEAKGATKLSIKLKQEIEKRETLIKQITNQDPSNQSQSKSIKRLPSQSGDRPASNFKKQNKIQDVNENVKTQTNVNRKNQLQVGLQGYSPQVTQYKKFSDKNQPSRANDVVIRHLSHSNRFSQSKKSATVNNSVQKTKQRKQSYDQKPHIQTTGDWKGMAFPQNLKNFGYKFLGNQYKK